MDGSNMTPEELAKASCSFPLQVDLRTYPYLAYPSASQPVYISTHPLVPQHMVYMMGVSVPIYPSTCLLPARRIYVFASVHPSICPSVSSTQKLHRAASIRSPAGTRACATDGAPRRPASPWASEARHVGNFFSEIWHSSAQPLVKLLWC